MELHLVSNTMEEVEPINLVLDLSEDFIPSIDLDMGNVSIYHDPHEEYEGPYIIKAGFEDWLLNTYNKVMHDDLEIQGVHILQTTTMGTDGYTVTVE